MEKKLDCFSREVLGILESFFSFSCGKNCYGGNGLQVPQYGSDAVIVAALAMSSLKLLLDRCEGRHVHHVTDLQ